MMGPDPHFREPGANTRPDRAFWTVDTNRVTPGQPLGSPEDYARRKAASSGEGRPAIVEVQVPEWIVRIVLNDPVGHFNALSGAICFELGCGLDELMTEWLNLIVTVRDVP
jgi:hypothetical protein